MNEFLESLNLSPTAVLAALGIAGGILTAWMAIVLPARVIIRESTPVERVKRASFTQKLDDRIREMGLTVDAFTLITRGLLVGMPIAVLFFLLELPVAAVLALPAGIYVYYEYLIAQQEKFAMRWKDEFINAMEDFIDGLGVTGNIVNTISLLASSSPSPLMRPIFTAIYRRYVTSGRDGAMVNMGSILRNFAESRAYDPVWYQFFITLSEAEKRGGQITAYIRDLIEAARQEVLLLERYFSTLTQARIIGISYALFPLVTLLFLVIFFPNDPALNLRVVDSSTPQGILIQVISIAGAVLTWYVTRLIIRSGLNLQDQLKGYRLEFREEDVLI